MISITKKISIAALSVGIIANAFAQKVDAKAKTILDQVSANYKAKKNTYFKFLYGSGSGKVQKTQTGIFYSEGAKYKLKIMGTEQIFDGKKIYNITDEDQEVTIAVPNENAVLFSPTSYLDDYKKGYQISYIGKRNIAGISTDLIQMKPVGKNEVKAVYLFINTVKNELVKLEQYTNNNEVAVIQIQDYKYNQNLNSNLFSFDKNQYKNYIITEL